MADTPVVDSPATEAPGAPEQSIEQFIEERNANQYPFGIPPLIAPRVRAKAAEPAEPPTQEKKSAAPQEPAPVKKPDEEGHKAAVQAAYQRGVAEATGAVSPAPQTPAALEGPPKPVIDQFDTYEAYEKALSEWGDRVVDFKTVQPAFMQRIEEVKKVNPKVQEAFDRVGTELARLTQQGFAASVPISEYIRRSPQGARVLLHLHENHEELNRIVRMNPLMAVAELGEIEGKLKGTTATLAAPRPAASKKKGTLAPVSPLESVNEFMKRRNEEQYGRRRKW